MKHRLNNLLTLLRANPAGIDIDGELSRDHCNNISIAMFESIRNYVNNLQYSERFENNNFAYYNDYEAKSDFDSDLTKMFYNCSRKTVPLIALFSETVRDVTRTISIDDRPFKTLDDLIHRFYAVYNENNYSDVKDDLEEFKYRHAVMYYPDEFNFFKNNPERTQQFI